MEHTLEGDWLVTHQMYRENNGWHDMHRWVGSDSIWHLPKGMGMEIMIDRKRLRAIPLSPRTMILEDSLRTMRIEIEKI
jgi:hypothetical protein